MLRSICQSRDAGANRLTIEMNSAGATSAYPTPEFGPSETEQVPNHPEERHIWIGIDAAFGAVDAKLDHQRALLHSFCRSVYTAAEMLEWISAILISVACDRASRCDSPDR